MEPVGVQGCMHRVEVVVAIHVGMSLEDAHGNDRGAEHDQRTGDLGCGCQI